MRIRGAPSDCGVRFDVNDEGSGIPPGEVERIFDRFYRVDAARASESGGAGLGLAIARSIVDLHGGTIRAGSRLPVGFSVTFEIPS